MKHKVSELEGALLDAAVGKADGRPWRYSEGRGRWLCPRKDSVGRTTWVNQDDTGRPSPSTNWAIGGPIIERERIVFDEYDEDEGEWYAFVSGRKLECAAMGFTMLVAGMRCYVTSKFGEEVDLP